MLSVDQVLETQIIDCSKETLKNDNFRFLRVHKINYIVEEDNALNGPTKQAPWITFNGVNHGDSQVESLQGLNFILAFNLYNFDN